MSMYSFIIMQFFRNLCLDLCMSCTRINKLKGRISFGRYTRPSSLRVNN